mgnify:CR=1 FL=1
MASLEDKMARRAAHVRLDTVVDTIGCPETGGGIVIVRRWSDGKIMARLYKPRTIRTSFKTLPVTSAHARLELLDRLRSEIASEKARARAPHPLTRGTPMVRIRGVTMKDADFFVVSDVPSPRTVRLAEIPRRFESGDAMYGTVVPDLPDTLPPADRGTVMTVSMITGSPEIRENSISVIRPWRTDWPVWVYAD